MGQLRRMAKFGVPLVLALTLAACGSGSKPNSKPGSKSSTSSSFNSTSKSKSTTTTVAPTTTTIAAALKTTLTAAVTAFESGQGVKASEYTIGRLETSGVDPTWALFTVLPVAGETNLQGGYGFAHMTSGNWSVVGFGSSAVGCPPGAAGNETVPAKVLAGFNLSCSTSHS